MGDGLRVTRKFGVFGTGWVGLTFVDLGQSRCRDVGLGISRDLGSRLKMLGIWGKKGLFGHFWDLGIGSWVLWDMVRVWHI